MACFDTEEFAQANESECENTILVDGCQNAVRADIVLEDDTTFSIYGRITDSSGWPVSGASVVLVRQLCDGRCTRNEFVDRTTTDSCGDYRFTISDDGNTAVYRVMAFKETVCGNCCCRCCC